MTGKERIEAVLRREQPDAVPTFEWFLDAGVGKALTGSSEPVEIIDGLDLDGINIRADYSSNPAGPDLFTDEWGATRKLTGDSIAAVMDSPIKDIADHGNYRFPDPEAPHRFQSLENALERFGDKRAIILNLRDGFSDMRDLLSYEEALMQSLAEPELFAALLDRVVEYNMAGMKAEYGDRICLKGNIDCKGPLCDGTPEEVETEVRQCLADGGAGGGLILSSSNTIHRGVKPENYRAMLAALREYGRY